MSAENLSPLENIEARLRPLLPADLYVRAWIGADVPLLQEVFNHLRTLRFILYDYVSREIQMSLPKPGQLQYNWFEGTLMFTDLAGFTPLMEANAGKGHAGAEAVLRVLNSYFATMIEITSKAGGDLLEFTGDALLFQFARDRRGSDTERAVRAGLRMQRAMGAFAAIETDQGYLSLSQRIGIHCGRFFTADIGTPIRMEHVLLGSDVQITKRTEGAGIGHRVNLTGKAYERVSDKFDFEEGTVPGNMLVVDNLSENELGEYDIVPTRRPKGALLLDRSVGGLLEAIEGEVNIVEPLAAFIPNSFLKLLVENAAQRQIPPEFAYPAVVFVNIMGLPEAVDEAGEADEVAAVVGSFSKLVAMIDAAASARGGVLKKVTYHLAGSDVMIFFGVPNAHSNDPLRAADAALAIRRIIETADRPVINRREITLDCQIGIAFGPVFAAEIGEPRGRREFNVLGDTVNTAARLMGKAVGNRIMVTEAMYQAIGDRYRCDYMGSIPLKGKSGRIPLYALNEPQDG